jgi:hypothetical protein
LLSTQETEGAKLSARCDRRAQSAATNRFTQTQVMQTIDLVKQVGSQLDSILSTCKTTSNWNNKWETGVTSILASMNVIESLNEQAWTSFTSQGNTITTSHGINVEYPIFSFRIFFSQHGTKWANPTTIGFGWTSHEGALCTAINGDIYPSPSQKMSSCRWPFPGTVSIHKGTTDSPGGSRQGLDITRSSAPLVFVAMPGNCGSQQQPPSGLFTSSRRLAERMSPEGRRLAGDHPPASPPAPTYPSSGTTNMETSWVYQPHMFHDHAAQKDVFTGSNADVQTGWDIAHANVTFEVGYEQLVSGLVNQRCDFIDTLNGNQGLLSQVARTTMFTNPENTTRLTYADCGVSSPTYQYFREARRVVELWKVKQEAVLSALNAEVSTIDSAVTRCKQEMLMHQAQSKNLGNQFLTYLNLQR